MSDQINIDVNINTDELNQIPQLKTAIDALNNSVNNLNKEIFNYNQQAEEATTWGTKIKNTVKDLGNTFESVEKLIKIAKIALEGWQGILAASFTLITTFGPQILNFFNNMFESDKARKAAQSLKNYKDIMESYIDKISTEISQTQLLVNVVNSKAAGDKNRAEALKKLINLSPEHLQNLTLENIKTKEGKQLLDEYINSLNRKAMMEATEEKRGKLVKQRYALKDEYDAALQNRIAYNTGKKQSSTQTGYTLNGTYIENGGDEKKMANIRFKEIVKQDQDYIDQIKKVDDDLATALLKYAPKTVFNQKGPNKLQGIKPKHPKKDKENDVIDLDAQRKKANDALMQTAIALNKKTELEHNSYLTEQSALQTQLDNKLISQEEYSQQSQQLEEKYHLGIGDIIKRFNKEDLDAAQKQQQEMVDAQQHDQQMAGDENAVKKAIMPADKLAAEKKLITDKYDFEIQQAAAAGKDTAAIREQYEQEITVLTKKHEQDRRDFAMQSAQKVSDAAFGMLKNSIQSQSDAKIKGLETQKQVELSNSNLTATQKQAIEDKYKKKEADEKTKAFKAEQKASILQAVINGALAITKATSQTGVLAPFVIPGIIVETAIQVATIAAQKAPQYAKGGLHYASDGRGALLSGYSRTDDTNAYLRSGEAVVVSEAMRNPWARNLVSAINVAHGGRDFSTLSNSRGYAIGGIFTDGGNANRYYNQPVNDVKDLANTLSYQMINNFPPIYVDVKDVNNQQNILAQTVNRVNL